MPLEATMIVIDNSEYMRNGDYQPTRFDAQADAVNAVFNTKIDSNPENTVGIMTMAGKGAEVLVTHTKELGQILSAVHAASSKVSGAVDIPTAIAIAQLALKHRQNKNLRQRIVVFVASPLDGVGVDEKNMVRLAKRLKKNNVAVDIVTFGDGIEEGERSVLRSFVDAANSGDNSHLLAVPPGAHLLSDMIMRSPILAGDLGLPEGMDAEAGPSGAGAGAGGGGNNFEFGIDPSIDPELAMALRMSMEEEQARQAAITAAAPPAHPPVAAAALPIPAGSAPLATAAASVPAEPTDDEEEAMLQQALALSKEEDDVDMSGAPAGDVGTDEDEEMDEEEAIARAIAMSMEEAEGEKKS